MAKKSRRSKMNGTAMTVAGLGTGLVAGGVLVPKLVAAVDKEGKMDPKILSALGVLGGAFLAHKTKGFLSTAAYGFAAGQAADLARQFIPGIGYVDSPTYDVNRVAGNFEFSRTAAANPGSI